jgi:hypothetical protein
MTSMRSRLAPLLALALLTRSAPAVACVMCGSSFGEGDRTMGAFMSSVLAAPYTVFFSAAACLYFLYRRGSQGRRASVIPLARWRSGASAETPKEVTP